MNYLHAFLTLLNAMSPYLLLGFFIAGLLHAFVPTAVYSRYLSGTGFRSVCLSALFGIPLPLCSCGVLPTAVSLRRSGASRASSTSFLIATPQTGVDSIAATYSMMGGPFAVLRPVAALVTAFFGGMAVGALERRGKLGADSAGQATEGSCEITPRSLTGKMWLALRFGFFEMMQNIGRWLLFGLVVATLITVLVPDDFFVNHANNSVLNMVVILVIAIPMYICATGSIPIAAALMLKGLSPGCALVMLMAGPAANVASMIVVSRTFGSRAMLCYLVSIIAGAMGFGLLIDLVPSLNNLFTSALPHYGEAHGMGTSWLNTLCSALLVILLVAATIATFRNSFNLKNNHNAMKQFRVKGMMCNHCKANVEKGVASLAGVTRTEVDLAQGIVYVEGNVDDATVKDKIAELGYENIE